jgi:hypothetical protein
MKGDGSMDICMVRENFLGLMEQAIQVNTTMAESTVKEHLFFWEESITKVCGKTAVKTGTVFFEIAKTRSYNKEYGRRGYLRNYNLDLFY